MTRLVRFEPEADEEYRLSARWYEERRANLGFEFLNAIDATIKQIRTWPDAGSLVPQLPPDSPVRRRAVSRFPYHVVYLNTATHVRILAVAHDRRRPAYWHERLR